MRFGRPALLIVGALLIGFAPEVLGQGTPSAETFPNGEGILSQLRTASSKGAKLVADASGGGDAAPDMVKLNCVNAKIALLNQKIGQGEDAGAELRDATSDGDLTKAEHAHQKLSVAADEAAKYLQEAEACVGGMTTYAGETENETSTDEDMPTESTTQTTPPPIVTTPPPAASPFQ